MKKNLPILLVLLAVILAPKPAYAGIFGDIFNWIVGFFAKSPLGDLSNNIVKLAELINKSTSEMMRFGDMLMCSGLHGAAADINILGGLISIKFIAPAIWLSGAILYVIGFLILLLSSFYLFDAAFNLSISIILLPLVLALWPFGWTRDKLKIVIHSILYYVGLFIFLPLGILIAKELAFTVVENTVKAAANGEFNFEEAYQLDKSDLIEENLGVFCMPFLKVLLCYIVAIRIIPTMAMDFCKYFFGSALVGNPMMERITQAGQHLMRQGKRVGKFGKDVAKHQIGKRIENAGKNMNGFFGRMVAQYGKNMAKTRKGR